MPQKFKPYTNPKHDGRVKISEDIKEKIKSEYQYKIISYAMLAKKYNVSLTRVINVIRPKTRTKYKAKKYSKEDWNAIMKKYRDKKRKLGLAY
jgi:hypothetical protein